MMFIVRRRRNDEYNFFLPNKIHHLRGDDSTQTEGLSDTLNLQLEP